MLTCINKNSLEYQSLKERAGIPEFLLDAVCRNFLEKYDRFPHLDEIPGSNSESYLRKRLQITNNNSVNIKNLLELTGKENIEDAVININDLYRDLEMEAVPIVEKAIVDISHKPNEHNFETIPLEYDDSISSYLTMMLSLQKLANLYGIKFIDITDAELASKEWRSIIPDGLDVNAFVYNSLIYINVDRNTLDSPIHEMFHIFIGSLRFTNPELYLNLIDSMESLPEYKLLILKYPNRSRNDINEEILVTEVSKYLAGYKSYIPRLDNKTKYELTYNIKRMLDIILMGLDSVKTIPENKLFKLSFKDIAKMVNSALLINSQVGTLSPKGSELHRKLSNMKSDLLKDGTLIELCD